MRKLRAQCGRVCRVSLAKRSPYRGKSKVPPLTIKTNRRCLKTRRVGSTMVDSSMANTTLRKSNLERHRERIANHRRAALASLTATQHHQRDARIFGRRWWPRAGGHSRGCLLRRPEALQQVPPGRRSLDPAHSSHKQIMRHLLPQVVVYI